MAIKVIDAGAGGVPPVFMDGNMADSTADEGIAFAMQVEAAIKLAVAVFMLGLKDGKHVNTRFSKPAHGLYLFRRAKPVDSQKSFVNAYLHQAAADEVITKIRMIAANIGN